MNREILATLAKSFNQVTFRVGFPAPLSQTYNRRGPGMASESFINDPGYWRTRAEEARILAKDMNDTASKDAMLRIADDYEQLAQSVEDWAMRRVPKN